MITSKDKIIGHLKIVEGQVRGLQMMIQKGGYCFDIINQTWAIIQSLNSIEETLIENHLSTCTLREIQNGNGEKAIDEIIRVYKLKRK